MWKTMNRVTLRPDGALAAGGAAVAANPLQYLGHQIDVAPGCTLRSYFKLLDTYDVFSRLTDFFEVLKQQHDACPGQGCLYPDLDCLEFAKVVEMVGFPGEPRLDIYNSFHGVSGDASEEIRTLPLNVLLDMPVRLGELKHVIFGDTVDTFRFETVYTLFEFIDGIAWELSFHGAPPECQIRS